RADGALRRRGRVVQRRRPRATSEAGPRDPVPRRARRRAADHRAHVLPRPHRAVSGPRHRRRARGAREPDRLSRRDPRGAAPLTRALAVALGIAVVAGCGPGTVVRRGEVNVDALQHIRIGIEKTRGLRFKQDVPGRALDTNALAAALAHELDLAYKPGDL